MPLQQLARARALCVCVCASAGTGWRHRMADDARTANGTACCGCCCCWWWNRCPLSPAHPCAFRKPPSQPHLTMASSSSAVHGPLCTSGLSTFCQRCRHCTSVRSIKCSAAQHGETWRDRGGRSGGAEQGGRAAFATRAGLRGGGSGGRTTATAGVRRRRSPIFFQFLAPCCATMRRSKSSCSGGKEGQGGAGGIVDAGGRGPHVAAACDSCLADAANSIEAGPADAPPAWSSLPVHCAEPWSAPCCSRSSRGAERWAGGERRLPQVRWRG